MILLNLTGLRWRWFPERAHSKGYYLTYRWLGFQVYFYTPLAAEMIASDLSNPVTCPRRSDRND